VVVPNGVDLDEPARPEPLELPFYRFVLAMGRVVEKKGFDLLIDAFGQVASQVTDVGLVIGGEGAARPALMAQAETAGLSDRVLFPGRLGRGQVAWATREAAVFVLPSRVEPFGIVVLEAMSAGAPVVVSSRGGAREIVRDGIDGLVADPFDTDALAGALTRVLAEPALGMRLVASAKARVKEFDWDPITERYVDLYGEAGGRNGSTRA
jgi:glycosyltransferase involved in cell wall biosynthesis